MTTTLDPATAPVTAGTHVVLCGLRIGQQDRLLPPAHAATSMDLTTALTDRPEIVGARPGTTP